MSSRNAIDQGLSSSFDESGPGRPRLLCGRILLGALLATSVGLAGCIPWPHQQRRAPALSGVVLDQAGPRAGVKVHRTVNHPPRSAADQCLGSEVTLTDAQGRFSFPESKKQLYFFVMGDRLDTWALCIEAPEEASGELPGANPEGGSTTVWSDSGYWGGPAAQHLRCGPGPSPEAICLPQPASP